MHWGHLDPEALDLDLLPLPVGCQHRQVEREPERHARAVGEASSVPTGPLVQSRRGVSGFLVVRVQRQAELVDRPT